ncbi:MAG: thiamine diphosphokinase [Chloroflexota bacterium]|nr:thiamine diphosphokinase [Chloroflexota bacterium]
MNQHSGERAILLANGELYDPDYARSLLRPDDLVIVANGGTRLAWTLQIVPDLLVGDGDSLPDHLRAWLDKHEVPRHEHPREKEATDLELALQHAIGLGATTVLLLGATGSRVDHTLANISLLALAREAGIAAEVVVERQHLFLVYDRIELRGEAGQTVSLLPWGGSVEGVRTEGLLWELNDATLPFGPSRGISNIMLDEQATVTIERGMLLVVQQRGELR